MYSSLHKIDIVVDDDGAPLCVQTDHRDALQMSAERELSVVFGITRMLAPRFADPSHERLVYLCAGGARRGRLVGGARAAGFPGSGRGRPDGA